MGGSARTSDAAPATLNTHHVIKVIALVIMTIDHIGAFLYPDNLWWRAIGRITFPVWFFLVGHALTYRVHRETLLWALVLGVTSPFLGQGVFPLNALVTIMICQLLLARIEHRDWLTHYPWTVLAGSALLVFPSFFLMEYGALGFLYALMGYIVRSGRIRTPVGVVVTLAALLAYLAMMLALFAFDLPQQVFVIAGTCYVTWRLARFTHRPVAWPQGLASATRLLSRYSLQYYVLHRILLQAIGVITGALSATLRWF